MARAGGQDSGFDWGDLRPFLAVLRSGSTLAAARELGVNQSTVARRIAALEAALGCRLFDRHAAGYRATERAQALQPLAEAIEARAEEIAARTAQWRRTVSGRLRVTATESVANLILAPLIASLHDSHPGLVVELITEDRRLDLEKGEADLAVRVGSVPDQDGLVARRLPDSVWAIFAAPDYLHRHGQPGVPADLAGHRILLGSGQLAANPALLWLEDMAPRSEIAARANSIAALTAAVRAGTGVSTLPHVVAAAQPGLVRLFGPDVSHASPAFLVYHQSQRDRAELRLFAEAAAARLTVLRPTPEG